MDENCYYYNKNCNPKSADYVLPEVEIKNFHELFDAKNILISNRIHKRFV